jgi:hypothetical protein
MPYNMEQMVEDRGLEGGLKMDSTPNNNPGQYQIE